MKSLRVLSLANNQISDISSIMGLRNLKTLILMDNPYEEAQIDALKLSMPRCEVVLK